MSELLVRSPIHLVDSWQCRRQLNYIYSRVSPYGQTINMVNSELRSLFHRTNVVKSVLLVLRLTVNPLVWSILERTNGDRISKTLLYMNNCGHPMRKNDTVVHNVILKD